MKINFDTLVELTQDPEYRNIPKQLALGKLHDDESWALAVDAFLEEGVKTTVWKISQLVAILFDTYSPTIESVSLELTVDQDCDDSYLYLTTKINNRKVFSQSLGLAGNLVDLVAPWKEVDDLVAIRNVLAEISGMGNARLIPVLDELKEHLSVPFTSAKQARQLAQQVFPQLNSWAKSKVLADGAGVGPVVRSSPKM